MIYTLISRVRSTHLLWFWIFQACVDPNTKDELHMVEMEGQDSEGQKVKTVLVSLKPSTLPSVSNRELLVPLISSSLPTPVKR